MPAGGGDTLKWIFGLGNPGKRYGDSRHNIGFSVIDRLAAEDLFEGERRRFSAIYREKPFHVRGEGFKVVLAKPQTYMNLSGNAVRDLLSYFGTSLEGDLKDTLLVIYDDLDLAEGRLRFRARGSSGGHRGVESVISSIGNDRFGRLRIGIGREPSREASDYVLEPVRGAARERFLRIATEAAGAARAWIEDGIEICMNRFNAAPSGAPEAPGDGGRTASPGAGRPERPETGG